MRAFLLFPILGLTCAAVQAQCTDQVITPTSESGSTFGKTLALDGAVLAVTADSIESLTPGAIDIGGINLYERGPTGWSSTGVLRPSSLTASSTEQYTAVAVHGGLLAAGYVSDFQHRVDVYERVGANWTQVVTLASPVSVPFEYFGDSIALADDTVLVDTHLYEKTATGWTYRGELPSGGYPFTRGTRWNDVNDDWIVVGDTSFISGSFIGAVQVYRRTPAGPVHFATLAPDVPILFLPFGNSVSLDGDRIAAAVQGFGAQGGHVAIFEFDGTVWTRVARLDAVESGPGIVFAREVALSGERLAVNAGSLTYLYERIGGTWTLIGSETILDSDTVELDGDVLVRDGGLFQGLPSQTVRVGSFRGGTVMQTCAGTPNSTGAVAAVGVRGSLRIADASLVLEVENALPAANGLFIAGGAAGSRPLGNGLLCIDQTSGLMRLGSVLTTDGSGSARSAIDFASLGSFGAAGTPVHFQFWFREAVGAGYDWSDAIEVTFCP